MEEYSGYVGLDVHKETISPALANPGRSKPESLGVIANTKKSIQNLVHRLSREGEVLGFCYEAGPCGPLCQHRWDTSPLKISVEGGGGSMHEYVD